MKKFMDENFMLNNETAVKLYNEYAKDLPIIDYHCHLSPKEIAENKKYSSITDVWLGGDHYKWRAMRANGVEEKYVTGDAPEKEKFMKWAETMNECIGNPLYHWTHMELKQYFGVDELLTPETAEKIWDKCNAMLKTDALSARELIKSSNVHSLCTTDDPTDTLEYHKQIAADKTFNVKVLPAWRPDKGVNIDKVFFLPWIEKLGKVVGKEIKTFADLTGALKQRLEYFHEVGCRLSDHAQDPVVFELATEEELTAILQKALKGEKLSTLEVNKYKTNVMLFLGRQYARLGWVMQLHINCIRNNSTRLFKLIGPDTGFDAVADHTYGLALSAFMDKLDETNELPKTILYSLNQNDNEMLASIGGCFQGGGIPGKVQLGSGWWYNDQKDGMIKQMTDLANIGLLSKFVGMLTDSRSFLSYPRHDYFRRILCDMIGEWVEIGEAPNDMKLLGKMVQNICFYNAKTYFGV